MSEGGGELNANRIVILERRQVVIPTSSNYHWLFFFIFVMYLVGSRSRWQVLSRLAGALGS